MQYELHTTTVSKLTSKCTLKCAYSPGPLLAWEKEESLDHLTAPCQSAWASSHWELGGCSRAGERMRLRCCGQGAVLGEGNATSPHSWMCPLAHGCNRFCG